MYRVWLKSILSHNKHGVFARKYANEEIPMTSKLFIVMAQCAIKPELVEASTVKRKLNKVYCSDNKGNFYIQHYYVKCL